MSYFSIAKGFHKLTSHLPPDLTQKELDRLRAITIYKKTRDVSLVCRTFGISRATLYRWVRRFNPNNLNSLEQSPFNPFLPKLPPYHSNYVFNLSFLNYFFFSRILCRWGIRGEGNTAYHPIHIT